MSAPDHAAPDCEFCPDGHRDPSTYPWAVWVGSHRDSDGQPTLLIVAKTGEQHVHESDAQWVRDLLNRPMDAASSAVVPAERNETDKETDKNVNRGGSE